MDILGVLGPVISRALDFIPNPAEKARVELEMKNQLMAAVIAESQGQLEVNKNEASHPSVFVAGWRPAIGWICAFGFAWQFLITPIALWIMAMTGSTVILPSIDVQALYSLTMGMLGMGALRTYEKMKGVARK